MDQRSLIAAVEARAPALPRLRALFLAGSFGRGDADAVSDVDLLALVEPEHQPALATAWRGLLAEIMPVAHWMERRQPVLLVNAIGDDWVRCDLSILHPALLAARARDQLRALFDPQDLIAGLPATLPPARPDPARITATVEEFTRVLGLLPVVATRGEWVVGAEGVAHLRRLFSNLLLEETILPDRGGALHLGRLLPADAMDLLAALPYPSPTPDDVTAAHVEIARVFYPRARAMTDRYGAIWPERFEAATRRHLADTLGIVLA